jgi:pimeloyl-ACP methyl ester carboxylesterase
MPLVFFHGLGIGLVTYIPFILSLIINQPLRPILLFEMPSISMIWEDNHILPKEYATHVSECLKGLKIVKCIMAGHSIGTALVRWMDLYFPEMIHGRIFIDPICFNLWTHHIAFNALYRSPRSLNEAFIKFVGMSEAGIATFLHRYFVWFQNTYFTDQLPDNCVIFLAGKDDIVNAPNVLHYLQNNKARNETRKIMYNSHFHHGQIMASPQAFEIIKEINKMG